MVQLELIRKKYTDKQTIGIMNVYQDSAFVCSFAVLEQEWRNNERNNSCIPPGFYSVSHYSSARFPNTFIVQDTEPRTYILIHAGTYNTNTSGCILLGFSHTDLNDDGYLDIIHSKDAIKKLNEICKGESFINLNIIA